MTLKKTILSLIVLCSGAVAPAQVPRPGDPEYTAQGRLLILRVVPKDQKAQLFLAGIKAGDVDLHRESKIVGVTLFHRGKKETLQVQPDGQSFVVQGVPPREAYQLEVQAESRGQKDQIKVQIPTRKP